MLARALRSRGFVVSVAHDCAQALAFEGEVDCAVLDIDLPDGNGLSLAKQLLGRCTSAVVFFSGSADGEVRQRAAELGYFVPKSAGLQELVHHIERAIHASTPADSSASFEAPAAETGRTPSASATFETPVSNTNKSPNVSTTLAAPVHDRKKKWVP